MRRSARRRPTPLSALQSPAWEAFLSLANSHHVILRALSPLQQESLQRGDALLAERCAAAIAAEQLRISNAIAHLQRITTALEESGCPVTVMKSLDHLPDLGNDLDLYTTAPAAQVRQLMTTAFLATIEPQSWGDRLAGKWNFTIPGLPEAVEVHAQRLGQTGEHLAMARRFVVRRVRLSVQGSDFLVPAPEERIIVATLQRMYRHFYFRICDLANIAALVDSGTVDFVELHRSASIGGIWPGVCALLRIVSEYAEKYRGCGIILPTPVLQGASFGVAKVFPRARFLRIPIVPEGARLYAAQLTATALQGNVEGILRLGTLPYLASAAAISYRLTGSDKGIW